MERVERGYSTFPWRKRPGVPPCWLAGSKWRVPDALGGTCGKSIRYRCGSAGRRPPSRASTVPIPPKQIEQAIAQVDSIVDDVMKRTGIPRDCRRNRPRGKPVLVKGYGVREVGKPEMVDPDTVFQLASVPKSVGATVIAHEVSDGKFAWDTPSRLAPRRR